MCQADSNPTQREQQASQLVHLSEKDLNAPWHVLADMQAHALGHVALSVPYTVES